MPTFAKAIDPERARLWREIFGSDEVEIISPLAIWASLPGFDLPQLVFGLYLEALSPEARHALVAYTAKRFGMDAAFVEANLEREGMPILAEHVTVTCTDVGLLMSLVDDDLDETDEDFWDETE